MYAMAFAVVKRVLFYVRNGGLGQVLSSQPVLKHQVPCPVVVGHTDRTCATGGCVLAVVDAMPGPPLHEGVAGVSRVCGRTCSGVGSHQHCLCLELGHPTRSPGYLQWVVYSNSVSALSSCVAPILFRAMSQ